MSKTSDTEFPPDLRFGEWLRQLREQRDLTLREVADAVAVDLAHLQKIELSQRLPTAEQTLALAKFFKQETKTMEARRIVEKFRMDYEDNPAAGQAVEMLHEQAAEYGAKKGGRTPKPS